MTWHDQTYAPHSSVHGQLAHCSLCHYTLQYSHMANVITWHIILYMVSMVYLAYMVYMVKLVNQVIAETSNNIYLRVHVIVAKMSYYVT